MPEHAARQTHQTGQPRADIRILSRRCCTDDDDGGPRGGRSIVTTCTPMRHLPKAAGAVRTVHTWDDLDLPGPCDGADPHAKTCGRYLTSRRYAVDIEVAHLPDLRFGVVVRFWAMTGGGPCVREADGAWRDCPPGTWDRDALHAAIAARVLAEPPIPGQRGGWLHIDTNAHTDTDRGREHTACRT